MAPANGHSRGANNNLNILEPLCPQPRFCSTPSPFPPRGRPLRTRTRTRQSLRECSCDCCSWFAHWSISIQTQCAAMNNRIAFQSPDAGRSRKESSACERMRAHHQGSKQMAQWKSGSCAASNPEVAPPNEWPRMAQQSRSSLPLNDARGDAFGLLPSFRPGAGAPSERPLSKPTAFWHSCALYLWQTHDEIEARSPQQEFGTWTSPGNIWKYPKRTF